MNITKKIFYSLASLAPMRFWRNGGTHRILLPYHHLVSNQPAPHIGHLYSFKNEQAFINDLDCLLKHFKPIHPDDLYSIVNNGEPIPKGSFLLSFDDGLSQVANIIAPILKQKGLPAIFFINPAFVDNKSLFYRCKISLLIDQLKNNPALVPNYIAVLNIDPGSSIETICAQMQKINQLTAPLLDDIAAGINFSFQQFLESYQPFLTRNQLIQLCHQGFTIGAHSINHPYYSLLSPTDQVAQTIGSCNYVNQLTGRDICHFSFPHSDKDISAETIQAINAQNKGLLFGIQNQRLELQRNMLHRFNAERPGMPFEKLIKGQLLLNSLEKLTGNHKVQRN